MFAAKVAGSDGADAADVATIDADRIGRLKAVFWDMNALTSEVETIDHPDSDPDDDTDDSWTEKILHITLTPKAAADMPTAYGFTTRQTDALDELLSDRAALSALAEDLTVTRADARELLDALPDDLDLERRAVVEAACSLVGKVNYHWDGKTLVIGWDSRWGQLQKVTAEGNSTTGTYRPYGLDCSGFVDWVFYNATDGAYYPGHGGGATMQHSYCTPISWEDTLPSDLVFYPGDEHVGTAGEVVAEVVIVYCKVIHIPVRVVRHIRRYYGRLANLHTTVRFSPPTRERVSFARWSGKRTHGAAKKGCPRCSSLAAICIECHDILWIRHCTWIDGRVHRRL